MKSVVVIWTAALITGLLSLTYINHTIDALALQAQQFDGYNSTTDYLQTAAGTFTYQAANYGTEFLQGGEDNTGVVLQNANVNIQ